MRTRDFLNQLDSLSKTAIIHACRELSSSSDMEIVIRHFQRKNDQIMVNQIFELIIRSEKYISDMPQLVRWAQDEDQINRLFEILIRPENSSLLLESPCNSFNSHQHKKAIFDLITKPENMNSLIKNLYAWNEYFFNGDEHLGYDEVAQLLAWVMIPENFNLIITTHGDFLYVSKRLLSLNGIDLSPFRECILQLDHFKEIFLYHQTWLEKNNYNDESLLPVVFHSDEDKTLLFKKFIESENCIFMSNGDGAEIPVPCFFAHNEDHLWRWKNFFNFSDGSNEKTKMTEFIVLPEMLCKYTARSLERCIDVYQYLVENSHKDKVFQLIKSKLKLLLNGNKCFDENKIDRVLDMLNEKHFEEVTDLILDPGAPRFLSMHPMDFRLKLGFAYIHHPRPFDERKMNKFLDQLLDPDNFCQFITNTTTSWKSDTMMNLDLLCQRYNKRNKFLLLIMKNFNQIFTTLEMLHMVGNGFPEYSNIFKQPTLKKATDAIRNYHLIYFALSSFVPKDILHLIVSTVVILRTEMNPENDSDTSELTWQEKSEFKYAMKIREELGKTIYSYLQKYMYLSEIFPVKISKRIIRTCPDIERYITLRSKILNTCKRSSSHGDLRNALSHFKNDEDALEEIFEYIIQSENFNCEVHDFVSYCKNAKQVDQLFEIAIRPDYFSLEITNFKSFHNKKIILDMLFQKKHEKLLIKKYFSWVNYFFQGNEPLAYDEIARFLKILSNPENTNKIIKSCDDVDKAFKIPMSETQKESLKDVIVDTCDLFNKYFDLDKIKTVFQTMEHRLKIFRQMKKPEHREQSGNITLAFPGVFMRYNIYLKFMHYFNFPEGSDEKNEMFNYLLFPDVLNECDIEYLGEIYEYFTNSERDEKLSEIISMKAAKKLMYFLYPETFSEFFTSHCQNDDYKIKLLTSLCMQYKESGVHQIRLLRLIMENAHLVVTSMAILHELQKHFPWNKAFSQPTLDLAQKEMSRQIHKTSAITGMFTFFRGFTSEITFNIAEFIEMEDRNKVACTCKNAGSSLG